MSPQLNRRGEGGLVLPPGIRQDYLHSIRQSGKRIVLNTVGASMAPLIRPGARVEIECVPISDIRIGDIILFERSGGLVLHRVIQKSRGASGIVFTEKGDFQVVGSRVREEFVLGRVTQIQNGERVIDPTSRKGRMLGRLITVASLVELGLFHIKQIAIGGGRCPLGPIWVIAGLRLRQFLMWFMCKR